LSAAILVSLVVSLTTTPMLSAKFLEAHSKRKHGRFYRWGEEALKWLTQEYERGLQWVLRHQGLVLTITIATFALNVYLYVLVPKGFFPQQDTGRLGGMIRGQQDVSFDTMKQKVIQMAAIVQQDPGVQNVMAFVGGGGPGGAPLLVPPQPPASKATSPRRANAEILRYEKFPERRGITFISLLQLSRLC